MFMLGGAAVWGQTPNDPSSVADNVDRASAYYHYTLAHMYAEMAASPGDHSREYVNQAIEQYRAAIKADPQAVMPKTELARIYTNGSTRLLRSPAPRLMAPVPGPQAAPPGQKLPKTEP
jgi:hypothetical protein